MLIKINSTRNYKIKKRKKEIINRGFLARKTKEIKTNYIKLNKVVDESKYQEILGEVIKSNKKVKIIKNSEYRKVINGKQSGTIYIRFKNQS